MMASRRILDVEQAGSPLFQQSTTPPSGSRTQDGHSPTSGTSNCPVELYDQSTGTTSLVPRDVAIQMGAIYVGQSPKKSKDLWSKLDTNSPAPSLSKVSVDYTTENESTPPKSNAPLHANVKDIPGGFDQASVHESTVATPRAREMFICEYECGFKGQFDQVLAHESICTLNTYCAGKAGGNATCQEKQVATPQAIEVFSSEITSGIKPGGFKNCFDFSALPSGGEPGNHALIAPLALRVVPLMVGSVLMEENFRAYSPLDISRSRTPISENRNLTEIARAYSPLDIPRSRTPITDAGPGRRSSLNSEGLEVAGALLEELSTLKGIMPPNAA